MARTVWGAHKRYMDTYLNVYKGYYVSDDARAWDAGDGIRADASSSPEMVLGETTRATIGSAVVWMTLSTCPGTGCLRPKSRQRSLSIVSQTSQYAERTRNLLTLATDSVAEAAVVGITDELTGQAVNAFVALKNGNEGDQTKKDLILQVRKSIGPFAAPKAIFVVPDLPKTRSGKIMRRILRKIAENEPDKLGDISTLADPTVVQNLVDERLVK